MKPRKIPMRMCIGCREMKPKVDLIRVVRNNEGIVKMDTSGKLSGRGAYICAQTECLERAKKTKALSRALDAGIDEALYEEFRVELAKRGQ